MPTPTGKEYLGPFTFDLSSLKGKLVDLVPGAMRRLRQEQDGFTDVTAELASAFPAHAKDALVPADLYQSFQAHGTNIAEMRAQHELFHKAAEVLEESIAKAMHDRENDISLIVKAVKTTAAARSQPELLAPFEKTIKYNAQTADKAAATRKKNEEAKAAEEEAAKNNPPTP